MERLANQNSTFPWFVLPLTEKNVSISKSFWPADSWLLSKHSYQLVVVSGATVKWIGDEGPIPVDRHPPYIIHSWQPRWQAQQRGPGLKEQENKQQSHNRMWLSCFHDSYPEQHPLDWCSPVTRSLAHWFLSEVQETFWHYCCLRGHCFWPGFSWTPALGSPARWKFLSRQGLSKGLCSAASITWDFDMKII